MGCNQSVSRKQKKLEVNSTSKTYALTEENLKKVTASVLNLSGLPKEMI